MSRILLQTTIPESPDDWDVSRFSLLADELRADNSFVMLRHQWALDRLCGEQLFFGVIISFRGGSGSKRRSARHR